MLKANSKSDDNSDAEDDNSDMSEKSRPRTKSKPAGRAWSDFLTDSAAARMKKASAVEMRSRDEMECRKRELEIRERDAEADRERKRLLTEVDIEERRSKMKERDILVATQQSTLELARQTIELLKSIKPNHGM